MNKFGSLLITAIKKIEIFHYYRDFWLVGCENDYTLNYYCICYGGDVYLQSCIESVLTEEGYGDDFTSFSCYTIFEYDKNKLGNVRTPREGYKFLHDFMDFKMWLFQRIIPSYSESLHKLYNANSLPIFSRYPYYCDLDIEILPKRYEHQSFFEIKVRLMEIDFEASTNRTDIQMRMVSFWEAKHGRKWIDESFILKSRTFFLNVFDSEVNVKSVKNWVLHAYFDKPEIISNEKLSLSLYRMG